MALDLIGLKKILYSRVNELPTLPVVIPKILLMMEDNRNDIKKLSTVIAYDPALVSKVLKVANSSYYGFPRKISEIERAVALLGFNMVKSLAISLGVLNTCAEPRSKAFFSETGLWFHSVAVATLTREINHTVLSSSKKDYLFVTALLHDIGKLIFDVYFSDLFERAIIDVENSGTYSLAASEKKIIGVDHGEVGALLLSRWNFPEEITTPVMYHHADSFPDEANRHDLAIIRIADALCQEFFFNSIDDVPEPAIVAEDLELLNMKSRDVQYLKNYLHDNKQPINSFFQSFYNL
ncbi:MAG: HDOD domain-containing protein [Spirochaetes bacterium]|jgi:putative nucleotidyltransferase with HDIG domain|nr:HDOD domain-containing protein [Spirochaetota bacterium]